MKSGSQNNGMPMTPLSTKKKQKSDQSYRMSGSSAFFERLSVDEDSRGQCSSKFTGF
jgi:hypothetical protein